jgi:hypothetical protein
MIPEPLRLIRFFRYFLVATCLGLTFWMAYLIRDLPVTFRANNWNLAWIGFDAGMLLSLATTTWSIWKMRQLAIPSALISATFLVIDAWFDITTSSNTKDFGLAIATGIFVELPSAAFLFWFSRHLIRHSISNVHQAAGTEVISLSLFRIPLTIFIPKER